MSGTRSTFIKLFGRIANTLPSKLLLNITDQKMIIPCYHIISDENVPHIRHLYTIKNSKNFVKDLDFLLKIFIPINYSEFYKLALNHKLPAKPSFLLTFDDGLKEFHDVIAPILINKGIPAICFLNSAFIDNKDMFYRYKASLLIDHLTNNPNLIEDRKVIDWLSSLSYKTNDIAKLLLSISYQDKHFLDELAVLMNYNFREYLSIHKPYLNGDQIQSLINKGFYFGAHSIDHPEFRFLDFNEQIRQTKESIDSICNLFSLDYRTFAFPFTDYKVSGIFFNKVYNDKIAEVTFGCAGQKKEIIPYHFQRISFEMDYLTAKEIFNSELLYFILKFILGKNTIKR